MGTRIDLQDTAMMALLKMSEGNPGAMQALLELQTHSAEIDPQAALGGLGNILSLDTHGIYGTDIYILYNDKCGRDFRRMIVLLRATQLGFFSSDELRALAGDQMRRINLTEEEFLALDDKVCERLEEFKKR